ncbi:fusion protein [Meliandou mastomys virus]|uniref:Fusion glycoprotein F0 n=1 Tax=Meliandou mastomys virus TaxID=2940987 RepID=A0AAE9HTX5_9MONO|nr:fusion protein [Meliandou mastomys virus]
MDRFRILLYILILLLKPSCIESQISVTELTKIGIIQGRSYGLKISGVSSYQYMIIKLVPNTERLNNCTYEPIMNYKAMLNRILTPINESIIKVRSAISSKSFSSEKPVLKRFWGAVIGGVALGVATAAQITAGVALHNSLENAKAIMTLKEAVKNSNKAIEELQTAQGQTVIALNALQEQINNQLVPAINTLGCQVIGNSLALRLNQYFSELSLVFGPNLRDPTSETLSIQAISKAFNGDFDSMMRQLRYDNSDLLDLLESGSIRGRIIEASLEDYLIVLQIEYPALTTIPDATIQLFNIISYNSKGSEWISLFPKQILIRGSYLSNIDLTDCVQTSSNYICKTDTSTAISSETYNCAIGNISSCSRTRVVNSHVARYALSQGVLFVNCASIMCRCQNPSYSFLQDPSITNIMVSSEDCKEAYIDGYFITLGPKKIHRAMYAANLTLGGMISVEPVDIGNEITSIQDSINKSQAAIDKSNELLDKVNPNIVNANSFGGIIAITIILLVWFVVTLIWLICLTKRVYRFGSSMSNSSRSSTVNSLSGFIN